MTEGYGPSAAAFPSSLKADGAELVITVDCGAAGHDALDRRGTRSACRSSSSTIT